MPLPPGVDTVQITFGSGVGFDGAPVTMTATATPDRDLVWAATKDPLIAYALKSTSTDGGGKFDLPAVDQAGFVQAGTSAPVSFWSYTIVVTYSGPVSGTRTYKGVQPLAAQTSIDLDLLPYDGSAQPPTIGTIPYVTSVNGQTGPVTVTVDGADVTIQAADITDSTPLGRNLITAADAAAARSAIQAGTSNLTVGTTSSTAKAGNWLPAIADVAGLAALVTELAADETDATDTAPRLASGRRIYEAFVKFLLASGNPWRLYWDGTSWPARNTVPTGWTGRVVWDSTGDEGAPQPPGMIDGDDWEEAQV